jgi:predicted nucleic acid-binding protein
MNFGTKSFARFTTSKERSIWITNDYLKNIGMYNVFKQHVNDIRILYESGDLGEVYAIAMAKPLDCVTLVIDDIKIKVKTKLKYWENQI